ncbi:MAG: triacylglycerol lipase [Lacrimispora sp.]|nr:triacylglycerol lipase [Lacrimispora sp.]
MTLFKRMVRYFLLMLLFNFTLLSPMLPGTLVRVLSCTGLMLFYLYYHFIPVKVNCNGRRLKILLGGCELLNAAIVCFFLELAVYGYVLIFNRTYPALLLVVNGIACAMFLSLLLINGIIRIFTCSGQLGLSKRIALLLLWWVPGVNLVLLHQFIDTSHKEYDFTLEKQQYYEKWKEEELCRTKYPILMVHGIFFRDWKSFNYWGRVPDELIRHGANIFYSNHQSSASVEQCGEEIKACILEIVKKTGCEKVNIIAHSKGGLDSRYAVSCLGMDQYVASITTINTPHSGCHYVCRILDRISPGFANFIGKRYESLFTLLGDDSPDFLSGLRDLTDRECARLNKLMKDTPGVICQSTGSQMRSLGSAMFPLNLGYMIIRLLGEGSNDGLVSTNSMVWGNDLGILKPKGKQGISHGDVIDLTRKNIEGFDVMGFYTDLVHKLKERGY